MRLGLGLVCEKRMSEFMFSYPYIYIFSLLSGVPIPVIAFGISKLLTDIINMGKYDFNEHQLIIKSTQSI